MSAIGGIVVAIADRDILRSGCEVYDCAVIVSIDPFILVSEKADMMWSHTVDPKNYKIVGVAKPETLKRCMKRLET